MIWGSTFFLTKQGLEALAASGGIPLDATAAWAGLIALRFGLASLGMILCFPGALGRLGSAALWKDAAWLALPTALGFALQTAGLARVSAGTSAFLTSLYVPGTPLAAWLLFRRRLPGALLPAILLAVAGLWMLTPPTADSFGLGEILSAACGLVFGVQIVLIDRLAARHDARALGAAMCILMLLIFLGVTLASPGGEAALSSGTMRALASAPARWFPIVFNGTVATVVPFWIMLRWQGKLDPSHAAVLYATEPLFAAGFSFWFTGERFGPLALAGAGLVIVANVWAGRAQAAAVESQVTTRDPPSGS